jgi:Secretion system C-terminal sorting domain
MYFRKIHILLWIFSSLLFDASSMFAQTWSRRFSDDLVETPVECKNIDKVGSDFVCMFNERQPYYVNDTMYGYWNLGMMKIDDQGELVFRRYYGDSSQWLGLGRPGATFADSNGNLWAPGSYHNLVDSIDVLIGGIYKFSSEGDLLITKYFGDSIHNQGLFTIRPTYDGNLIVHGSAMMDNSYPKNWTMKLDTLLNKIWSSYFASGLRNKETRFVLESDDSTQFLVGGYEDSQVNESVPRVWRISQDGTYLSTRNYHIGVHDGNAIERLISDGEGNYFWCGSVVTDYTGNVMSGKHLIVKLNNNLDTLWTRIIGPDYNMPLFETKNIIHTADGNFLCVGFSDLYQEFGSIDQGFIMKFSPDGDIIWQRHYEATTFGWNEFYDAVQADDGGYVVAGQTYSFVPTDDRYYEQDAWVVKTDEFGCIVPGCQVSILEEEEVADFSIYPNPSHDVLNIYLQTINPSFQGEILISDLSGRIISKHPTYGTNLTLSLDVSNFAKGMYLVQFQSNNSAIKTQRFVVE